MAQTNVYKTCPYCQYPIKSGSAVLECAECKMPHHRECWDFNGGCTTFGCSGTHRHPGSMRPAAAAPDVIDLSNIMSEQEAPDSLRRNTAGRSSSRAESPLASASGALSGVGGIIGAIVGFIAGLSGGFMCIPGLIIGFFVGALIGSILIYALIIGFCIMIGCMLFSAGGDDSMFAGGIVGFIAGLIIIGAASRTPGEESNGR